MDPYDAKAVAAVWQRVKGGNCDALEQALSDAITAERRAQATYAAMFRCCHYAILGQLAAQEAAHARKLEALYYLLYGCPACAQRQSKVCIRDFCQALRSAYQAECRSAQEYRDLAQKYPAHEKLFCALSKAEQMHAEQLYRLTQQLLR